MNAIRPVAVKLDAQMHDRVKRLAEARDRSTHWIRAPDTPTILIRHHGREIEAAFVNDILKRQKHPVDQPEIVLVLEAVNRGAILDHRNGQIF